MDQIEVYPLTDEAERLIRRARELLELDSG